MNIILSHSGKQHSYQVALALYRLGFLEGFYTSGYAGKFLQRISKELTGDPLQRRYIEGLPSRKVHANWHFEFKENWIRKIEKNPVKAREAVYQRDIRFDLFLSKILKKQSFTHFWGFQGSCHDSIQAAKQFGKVTICELATAHVTSALKILGEEQNLHPSWAHTIDNLVFAPDYQRRLEEEPHIADFVISASSFTKSTLIEAGVRQDKIKMLPLGFSLDHIPYDPSYNLVDSQKPLKLLYAGRVTQRKGMVYLLEALRSFRSKEVTLDIIGHLNGSEELLKPYASLVNYKGAKSQSELFAAYQAYDLLALPSIFEGFGLVIVEAMAAGLPVIATPHSIGPELIEHGKNGYIVPIRDPKAISLAISDYSNKSLEDRQAMRFAAREAALAYSWEHYQKRLNELVPSLMKNA